MQTPATNTQKRFTHLLEITVKGLEILQPLVSDFYKAINTDSELNSKKKDDSIFTIADGCVQEMLRMHLFTDRRFKAIVGEEDQTNNNISTRPYTIGSLTIPEMFVDSVDRVRKELSKLGEQINAKNHDYKDVEIFIDPIDGTREFSTGKGDQCTTCIGFSVGGRATAGVVYRHLFGTPTFASGCASESYLKNNLRPPASTTKRGFLVTNGAVSPFLAKLSDALGAELVKSGGAGNKLLLLIEQQGFYYIQDRGLSRWDTCAADAVLEALDGKLFKLYNFAHSESAQESYHYTKSVQNVDFVPGIATLTKYNISPNCDQKQVGQLAQNPGDVLPYANSCGMLALLAPAMKEIKTIYAAIRRVSVESAPAYD